MVVKIVCMILRNGTNRIEDKQYTWAGCETSSKGYQKYLNHHNIYYFEDMENLGKNGFAMGRTFDRLAQAFF